MKPKRHESVISYVRNSNTNSDHLLKNRAFIPFITIPIVICETPRITAIFIFKEFIKVIVCVDLYHIGSIPNGYTHSYSCVTEDVSLSAKKVFPFTAVFCKL